MVSLEATCAAISRNVASGSLELLHRRRVFLSDDEVDLVGEGRDSVGISDQVFRWCQITQRIAHFGKAAFNSGQGVAVDAGLSPFRDALAQA